MARHALLVGVSQFKDARLAALNAPTNDVEALAGVLRDPERGGFGSVTVSINPDFLTLRDQLAALFNPRDPDDLLLLYYSGHGILRTGNRLFLATPETDFEQPQARGIFAAELRDMMDQTRAERQVMVLDCCHSGAFAPGAKGSGALAVTDDTFGAGSTGRYVLTASDAQQFAWDGDRLADGDAATRTLSQFTAWLVDGLGRGEAAPDEPDITMDALFRYICRRAKAAGSLATPQRFVDRGSDAFVIGRNPAAAGAASVQALAGDLGALDWATRLTAAETLARLARSPATREAARDALAERLGEERDFKVRAVLLKALEQPAEPPPPPPPVQPPVQPQPERAWTPAAPVFPSATAQAERDALEARALRNGRRLLWVARGSLVFDVGIVQMIIAQHDWSGVGFLVGQVVGGGFGLLPGLWNKTLAAAPGLRASAVVTRSGLAAYESGCLRQACWTMLAGGILTSLIVAGLGQGR